MELLATRYADVVVLRLTGRVDYTSADAFGAALAPHLEKCNAAGDKLLIDLGGLEYISSAGLRIYMLAAKKAGPAGGKIALAEAQPVVAEILQISRFNLLFPMHATLHDALAALSAEAAVAYDGGG
jgi:anti-anti-sigma factor